MIKFLAELKLRPLTAHRKMEFGKVLKGGRGEGGTNLDQGSLDKAGVMGIGGFSRNWGRDYMLPGK